MVRNRRDIKARPTGRAFFVSARQTREGVPPNFRTAIAIGNPTQKICVTIASSVRFHENGPRRTADSGITTQYMKV